MSNGERSALLGSDPVTPVSSEDWGDAALPFTRRDPPMGMLEFLKSIVLGVLVAPFRVVFILTLVFLYYVLVKLMACGVDEPFAARSGWRYSIAYAGGICISYAGRLGTGMWVSHFHHPEARSAGTGSGDEDDAPTIVCNHVSVLDIVVLSSMYWPSYVSKAGVRDVPLFGAIGHSSLGSLWIGRTESGRSGERGSEALQARQNQFFGQPHRQPIVIFPEGTTSNGSVLLPFRRGAFLSGLPVRPVGLVYPFERFNPSFETIPLHYYLIRLVTQFVIPLHVHHFPVYYPTEEERADAALYAENVRKLMAETLHLPCAQSGLAEKKRFHRAILEGHIPWNIRAADASPRLASPV